MKRTLILMLVALVLAFATAGLASADGGPHGGYTATTDACAGCHRAHTAQAPKLLTVEEQSLCLSCHGSDGTGADTNVADGVYVDRDLTPGEGEGIPDRGLKGGGFINTLMNTAMISGTVPSAAGISSAHHYDGSAGTVWGSGPITGTEFAGATINLSCTNCHDPHGNGNYRILRPIPLSSGAITPTLVTDEAAKNYTVTDGFGRYFGEGYDVSDGANSRDRISQEYQEVTVWCTQCHTRYLAPSDPPFTSAREPSGDAIFKYRHMAGDRSHGPCGGCHNYDRNATPPTSPAKENVWPWFTYNDKYWNHNVECMTCHVAHGTSANMEANPTGFAEAENMPYPDGSIVTDSVSARSSLLRVDGRGTCQGCHDKGGPDGDGGLME